MTSSEQVIRELNRVRGPVVVNPTRLWRRRRCARNRSVRDAHMDQLRVSRHLAATWNESRMATVWVILVCRIISAHTGNPVLVSRTSRSGTTKPMSSEIATHPARTPPNWLFRLFRRLPDIEIVVVRQRLDRQVSGGRRAMDGRSQIGQSDSVRLR
jgi:hypothetical protein